MKILVSPGFGAGWSTWAYGEVAEFALTYQPLIEAIETGGDVAAALHEFADEVERRGWYFYMGGADTLEVADVHGAYRVTEYDGSESVEYRDSGDWRYA